MRRVRENLAHTSTEGSGFSSAVDAEGEEEGQGEDHADNCTHPRHPLPRYNDSCDFVHAECEGQSELIDYLAFVLCDLRKAQVYLYLCSCLCH